MGESFSHRLRANLATMCEASSGDQPVEEEEDDDDDEDLASRFCTICTAWLLSTTSHTPSVAMITNSSLSSTYTHTHTYTQTNTYHSCNHPSIRFTVHPATDLVLQDLRLGRHAALVHDGVPERAAHGQAEGLPAVLVPHAARAHGHAHRAAAGLIHKHLSESHAQEISSQPRGHTY